MDLFVAAAPISLDLTYIIIFAKKPVTVDLGDKHFFFIIIMVTIFSN